MDAQWSGSQNITSKKYTCSFCQALVASDKGQNAISRRTNQAFASVYYCSNCLEPTYFNERNVQHPSPPIGNPVNHLPPNDIAPLYDEICKTASAGCYTAAVLACRKLLMHIAVEKEAKDGLNFKKYIDYLDANGYIPPGCKDAANHIREKGNEANHEIVFMEKKDIELLLKFSEMLLKFIYEFPKDMETKN